VIIDGGNDAPPKNTMGKSLNAGNINIFTGATEDRAI
jgi:hypothetical protein